MTNYFIYALCDPRKPGMYTYPNVDFIFPYEPFYVGKGKGKRPHYHIWSTREHKSNQLKGNKIKKIINSGLNVIISIIESDIIDEQTAYHNEVGYISNIGSDLIPTIPDGPLVNVALIAQPPNHKGKTYKEIYGEDRAEEQRSKRHAAQLAAGGWFKGRKHTEETKRRQSQPGAKNGRAKSFLFVNPDGKEFKVTGEFKKFCESNQLSIWAMQQKLKGKEHVPTANGWNVFFITN